jgi:hypothetical protein
MKKRGGKRENAGRKKGQKDRTPLDLMKEMGCPDHWLSPVEFCLAVMNFDIDKLVLPKARNGKINAKSIPSIGQRLDAARIASPYVHQKQPQIVDHQVNHSWAEIMAEAEERHNRMRKESSGTIDRNLH